MVLICFDNKKKEKEAKRKKTITKIDTYKYQKIQSHNRKKTFTNSGCVMINIDHNNVYITYRMLSDVFLCCHLVVDRPNIIYQCLQSTKDDETSRNMNFGSTTEGFYISGFTVSSRKIFCLCYIKICCF